MVTILPIEVDENLVRRGIQMAVAERIDEAMRAVQRQLAELNAGGLLDREKWNAAVERFRSETEAATALLQYAESFQDQWPEDDDGA